MGEENLTLAGLDENGDDTETFPTLEVLGQRNGGAGQDGRSFICLRVVVNLESGEPDIEERPLDWLTVVHRQELPAGFFAGGMPEILEDDATVGLWPLAILYWDEDSFAVRSYMQVPYHNQQHRYDRGEIVNESSGERARGRHWFFGAE